MRPLLFTALLLASCGVLHAQLQESKLAERLLQPDKTLGNPYQNKSFYGSGVGGMDVSKSAYVKDFNFVQKFSAKSFDTKDYDSKDFWMGQIRFTTKAADVKTDTKAQKNFDTKAAPVKEAYEAGKTFDSGKGGYTTRDADVAAKGKTSQAQLDEKAKGKPMSIDEVRDLLNKPRLFN